MMVNLSRRNNRSHFIVEDCPLKVSYCVARGGRCLVVCWKPSVFTCPDKPQPVTYLSPAACGAESCQEEVKIGHPRVSSLSRTVCWLICRGVFVFCGGHLAPVSTLRQANWAFVFFCCILVLSTPLLTNRCPPGTLDSARCRLSNPTLRCSACVCMR